MDYAKELRLFGLGRLFRGRFHEVRATSSIVVTLSKPSVYRESNEGWIELYNRGAAEVVPSGSSTVTGREGSSPSGSQPRDSAR